MKKQFFFTSWVIRLYEGGGWSRLRIGGFELRAVENTRWDYILPHLQKSPRGIAFFYGR
jgi:hypothetical protein